jgi:hypothetical protein
MNRITERGAPAALLIMLAVACGGDEMSRDTPEPPDPYAPSMPYVIVNGSQEPDTDAGEVEKIYRNGGYGKATVSGGPRCDVTQHSYCEGPKYKTLKAKLYASTCSSWWQARWVAAEAAAQAVLALYGFTLTGTPSGQTPDVEWRCGSTPGLGSETPQNPKVWTLMGNGVYWGQPALSKIVVDSAEVEASTAWALANEGQRRTFAENVIRHEIGHSVGLGHSSNPLHLMYGVFQTNDPNALPWAGLLNWTSDELFWIDCYNPSVGSTSPDC